MKLYVEFTIKYLKYKKTVCVIFKLVLLLNG